MIKNILFLSLFIIFYGCSKPCPTINSIKKHSNDYQNMYHNYTNEQKQAFNTIRNIVRKNLRYPKNAIKQNLCGKVKIQFNYDIKEGYGNSKILTSSNHKILDDHAVATIKSLYNQFPKLEINTKFKVNLIFTLY